MDVELAREGAPRDLGLELGGDVGFTEGAATVRASRGRGGVPRRIDTVRRRGGAVAVPAVGRTALAAGLLRTALGRALGAGGGLTLASPAGGVAVGLTSPARRHLPVMGFGVSPS